MRAQAVVAVSREEVVDPGADDGHELGDQMADGAALAAAGARDQVAEGTPLLSTSRRDERQEQAEGSAASRKPFVFPVQNRYLGGP